MIDRGFELFRKSKKSIFPPSEYSALIESLINISDFIPAKVKTPLMQRSFEDDKHRLMSRRLSVYLWHVSSKQYRNLVLVMWN
jgi:hypothetical protein